MRLDTTHASRGALHSATHSAAHACGVYPDDAGGEVLLAELGPLHAARVLHKCCDAVGKSATVRPDPRHLLGEKQDVGIVMDGRDVEGVEPWDHFVIGVLIVLVRDELAVNILHGPRLRDLIHHALGVGHALADSRRHISKALEVLSVVDARGKG